MNLGKSLNYEGIKALGLHYNYTNDSMFFKLEQKKSIDVTKREILRRIMGYYDPCGLIEPLKFSLKVIMQSVHESNIAWDDKVSEEIGNKWLDFQKQLPSVTKMRMERCVHFNEKAQILIYADGIS